MDFSDTADNIDNTHWGIDDNTFSTNQDNILLYYTDDILDIFDDYKERFVTMPDFLCNLKGFVFVNFITEYISCPTTYPFKNTKTISENEIFEDIFKNELIISYNIIHKFIKQFKIDLSFNNWKIYCHKYSDIPYI